MRASTTESGALPSGLAGWAALPLRRKLVLVFLFFLGIILINCLIALGTWLVSFNAVASAKRFDTLAQKIASLNAEESAFRHTRIRRYSLLAAEMIRECRSFTRQNEALDQALPQGLGMADIRLLLEEHERAFEECLLLQDQLDALTSESLRLCDDLLSRTEEMRGFDLKLPEEVLAAVRAAAISSGHEAGRAALVAGPLLERITSYGQAIRTAAEPSGARLAGFRLAAAAADYREVLLKIQGVRADLQSREAVLLRGYDTLRRACELAARYSWNRAVSFQRRSLVLLIILLILSVAAAIWCSLYFSRSLAEPLSALLQGIAGIRQGDYSGRVAISRPDEFGRLAERFNAMAAELERSRSEVSEHQNRLEERIQERTAALRASEAGLRQATQQALLAQAAAEAANSAKSRFLANMSHELRTPLNPVIGFAEVLSTAKNLTDEQRRWASIISQRSSDLLRLIGDILDLTKIEAEKAVLMARPVELRPLLEDMVSSIRPQASGKNLALECEIASGLPEHVCADAVRLRQIILNLLSNAIKFTRAGRITVHIEPAEPARLDRPLARDEIALQCTVQDTGIGIPADKQELIFEAFKQADPRHAVEYGGTGLGLAIAGGLVRMMGGAIWVESVEGRGSRFSFTTIVGVGQAEAVPPVPPATTAVSSGSARKVLIVDDDADNRFLAKILFSEQGYEIRQACDGVEALQMLDKEAIDLVMMDIRMPRMDGLEATRAIRERDRQSGRHTPIIALTSFAMTEEKESFLAAGMDSHISKPIEKLKLFEAVEAVLNARQRG